MIAFGCAITSQKTYDRCAAPGIARAAEQGSEILAYASAGSIFRSYNLLLDLAAARDDLEALVLVHQDAEIVDADFCSKLRGALVDPAVALVGAAGAVGVRSIAYWEGSATWGSFAHRYREFGGGQFPALSWDMDNLPAYARTGEVDAIDGFVIALSPWAVRELRFDEGLGQFHGYDFDICLQARAAGRKVVTADLRTVHHHSLKLLEDREAWINAHMRVAEKWDGRMPGVATAAGDWRQRARRAEAEAGAARLAARAAGLVREAKVTAAERQLQALRQSTSWRLTAPMRALAAVMRRRRNGVSRQDDVRPDSGPMGGPSTRRERV